MAHVAWTLTDNSTGAPEVFQFPINPSEMDMPGREANISGETTVSPNGGVVLFQGRDKVRTGSFSGKILSQAYLNDFETWMSKWYPLDLVDDLANSWTILVTTYSLTRLRRASNPHAYEYQVQFMVMD